MEARGLRHYLAQKADSMRAAAARSPLGEQWHEQVEATCVADDATGTRKLRIRDWQFISDSGSDFGGWGLGPSSPELLCGVISSCLTHTYLIGAAMLSIPVDRVSVRVSAENNDARFLGIATEDPAVPFNFVAIVTLDASDATTDQVAALHEYAERCPLKRIIREAHALETVVVAPH